MKRYAVLAVVAVSGLVALSGCRTHTAARPHVRSEVRTDAPTEGRPTLGMPITVAGQDLHIVPFTLDRAMTWVEDSFGYRDEFGVDLDVAFSSFNTDTLLNIDTDGDGIPDATDGLPDGGSRWQPTTISGITSRVGNHLPGAAQLPLQPRGLFATRGVRWHNAILTHPEAGTSELVLDRRGVITQLTLLGQITYDDDGKPTTTVRAVLFKAIVDDTSGGGTLSSSDAQLFLAGDGAGNGLHPITPPGTQVNRVRYDHNANRLYLLLRSDTNGDKRFTQADQTLPYVYTPGDPGVAQPMVDEGLIKRAESYLR